MGNKHKSRSLRTAIGRKLKKWHYRFLADDIIRITKQFDDHIFTFPCHNSVGGRRLYSGNGYNRDETEIILDVLRQAGGFSPNAIALEFGGNIGSQTVYFALSKLFHKIITVEADAVNADFLRCNVSDNGFTDMVEVKQVALGMEDGMVTFYRSPDNYGEHSLLAQDSAIAVQVPCQSLQSLITESKIDFSDVAFIWSDLEGMDYEVFMQVLTFGVPPFYYLEFSANLRSAEDNDRFKQAIFASYQTVYLSKGGRLSRIGIDDIPADRQTNLLLCDPIIKS